MGIENISSQRRAPARDIQAPPIPSTERPEKLAAPVETGKEIPLPQLRLSSDYLALDGSAGALAGAQQVCDGAMSEATFLASSASAAKLGEQVSTLKNILDRSKARSQQPAAKQAEMSSALTRAFAEGGAARETARKMATELGKSEDKALADLGKGAEKAIEAAELWEKGDKLKAIGKLASAGGSAMNAAFEGMERAGWLEEDSAKALKGYLSGGLAGRANAVLELGQAIEDFGKGEIRNGLRHMAGLGKEAFSALKPLLKTLGVEDSKIDNIEKLVGAGKNAIDSLDRGMDAWDKGDYKKALEEFGGGARDLLGPMAEVMGEGAKKYAPHLGALAKSVGNLAGCAKDIQTMMDPKADYFARIDAAQNVASATSVEVLRALLVSGLKNEKAANFIADSVQSLVKLTVGYDQETGRTAREGQRLLDRAWNHNLKDGENFAALLGFKPNTSHLIPKDDARAAAQYSALENLPELWANGDEATKRALLDIQNTLRSGQIEKAKEAYFNLFQARQKCMNARK